MPYQAKYRFENIKYSCNKMNEVIKKAKKAAANNLPVFIYGESGTGKELFAQAIHNYGENSCGPFIPVNCAALPKNLIQSELFGYDEGAFTGAKKGGQLGKFQLANGGTIFLDEIGSMSMELQATLLRVLQEKIITPIGSNNDIKLDIRFIAAANVNLLDEIKKGNFREDLYYRISAINIDIPPLRERGKDIEKLFYTFMDKYKNKLCSYNNINVNDQFIKVLYKYKWPGNVRELQNLVISILYDLESPYVTIKNIPNRILSFIKSKEFVQSELENKILTGTLEEIEKSVIRKTLYDYDNNISAAAKRLGITRATLYRKMNKYNIKK